MSLGSSMRKTIVGLIVACVGSVLNATAAENTITMYSQASKGVVPIQELQSICFPGLPHSKQNIVTLGTGFFITHDASGVLSTWLVTARHVVEPHADLLVKAQVGLDSAAYMVLPHAQWIFHPTPSVPGKAPIDVAIMKVYVPVGTPAFRYCSAECTHDPSMKEKAQNNLGEAPEPTNHALFFGYPSEEVTAGEVPPFARSGIVAYSRSNPQLRISGVPIADDSVFYVDAPSFGGNSGGPVISEPGMLQPRLELFGLVTAGSPTRTYTIVTSVRRIKETIDYAVKQALVPQQNWSKTPPSFSHSCKSE